MSSVQWHIHHFYSRSSTPTYTELIESILFVWGFWLWLGWGISQVELTSHLDAPISQGPSIKGVCGFVPVECGYCQEKFKRRFYY